MQLAVQDVAIRPAGRSKHSRRVQQVRERDAAQAHAEAVQEGAAGQTRSGKWAGAVVVHFLRFGSRSSTETIVDLRLFVPGAGRSRNDSISTPAITLERSRLSSTTTMF